jgi:hypothetical protein
LRQSIGTHTVVTHGGGIHGFVTANLWVPDAELSVSVFANGGGGRVDQIAQQLARAALGVQAPRRVTLTDAERAQYVGVYVLNLPTGPRDFVFSQRDSQLFGQLQGQGANPYLPYGNHVFGADFDASLRITFTVEGGRATKLVLEQGGGRFEALRKP